MSILTPRELDVLRLLASGCSYWQAAMQLGISPVSLSTWTAAARFDAVDIIEDRAARVRIFIGKGHADLTLAELAQLLELQR